MAVPADIPVRLPVRLLMVATDGSLLVQLPPAVLPPSVAEEPIHTFVAPVIVPVEGALSTVSFHATLVGQP